jgi:glycosyltransferase involved in cell wall biosynthesis
LLNTPKKEGAPRRILHVVDDFSTANTGVTATVRQMAQWQARHCDWVGVHATGPVDLPAPGGVHLLQVEAHSYSPRWRYPSYGVQGLLQLAQEHAVTHLHVHEFWRGGFVSGMLAARRAGLPVLLSAHGSTAPWALHAQGMAKDWKKRIYWHAFGRFLLGPDVVLHAITPLEQRHMAAFFGRQPQAVIPNAIDLQGMPAAPAKPRRRRFVFLGRLHPVKGVDMLIEAFGRARLAPGWELLLAGPEEIPAYAQALKSLAAASPSAAHIRFAGPVHGPDKVDLLAGAWAVVVPSRTEVIGMVNLEAAALATPTITTRNTGLEEWESAGGMLVAEDDAQSLAQALEKCAAWSEQEQHQRGRRSQAHVAQTYSLEAVGQQWLRLYDSMQKDGSSN